jgi:hypothetical protein
MGKCTAFYATDFADLQREKNLPLEINAPTKLTSLPVKKTFQDGDLPVLVERDGVHKLVLGINDALFVKVFVVP